MPISSVSTADKSILPRLTPRIKEPSDIAQRTTPPLVRAARKTITTRIFLQKMSLSHRKSQRENLPIRYLFQKTCISINCEKDGPIVISVTHSSTLRPCTTNVYSSATRATPAGPVPSVAKSRIQNAIVMNTDSSVIVVVTAKKKS